MPTPSQYLFGYGSLVEMESRTKTWPDAVQASPVIVKGIQRGWFDQLGGPSLGTTFLGAVPASGAVCNGVVFAVTQEALQAYDQREVGYQRELIDPANITMVDRSAPVPAGQVWYYANQQRQPATATCPIVQSYVDLCLNGCLEIEAACPPARATGFARNFIQQCSDWSPWWVNDRLYPRRAMFSVPNATQIDQLIIDVLGPELFSQIELEPASWEIRRRP